MLIWLSWISLQNLDLHKDCKLWSNGFLPRRPPAPNLQTIELMSCRFWILISTVWHPICLRLPSHPTHLSSSFSVFLIPGYQPCSPCFPSTALARGRAEWWKRGSNYLSHTVIFLLEGWPIWLYLLCYFLRMCRNVISWRSVALSS